MNQSTRKLLKSLPGYDPFKGSKGKFVFDEATAEKAIGFIESCCKHCVGELSGSYIKLEKWQKAVVANLFGWKRKNGTRRYRHCLIMVPRKNGKSFLGACLALYLLLCDGEPGAEIYSAAGTRDQAKTLFDMAATMVQTEPALAKRVKSFKYHLEGPENSKYKVVSSEGKTNHGTNPHAVLFDEVWNQPNRELYESLVTGRAARRQPLFISISTAGYDKNTLGGELYNHACNVRDNQVDDPYLLPVIYEALDTDDWQSEKTWKKANPNYGVSVSCDYIKEECIRAANMPVYENTFKHFNLNMWTAQEVRWLSLDKWDICNKHVNLETLKGEVCYGGLDLSSKQDLTAFVLFFPKHHLCLPYYWVPADRIEERCKRDKVFYDVWAKQGHIYTIPGPVIEYGYVVDKIKQLSTQYTIKDIGFDRWEAAHVVNELNNARIDVVAFGQGYRDMSAPTKELERLVLKQQLNHLGHPVLRWNMGNVAAETDPAGNIKLSKSKSFEKIDGVIALVMAIGRATANGYGDEKQSVYRTRGIFILE